MKDWKNFRVDIFNAGKHETKYFDTEKEARDFVTENRTKKRLPDTAQYFLLRHIIDGKYDVVGELKEGV